MSTPPGQPSALLFISTPTVPVPFCDPLSPTPALSQLPTEKWPAGTPRVHLKACSLYQQNFRQAQSRSSQPKVARPRYCPYR
ncbi:hypothetical protein ACN47E_007045 [Coniothyrium glycines]